MLGPTVFGQVMKKIQGDFNESFKRTFQEKLFVQTDKNVYLTGELMWFKVYYQSDTSNNKDQIFSKLAYVEVLDENNNALMQAKIPLNGQNGNGSFYVPVTALNGDYTIRAYTNWMKNSPQVIFEKQLTIINPYKAAEKPKISQPGYVLQFFPEGGDLVDGIPIKVAFKATGKDGKGTDVSGVIVDQHDQQIARFKTGKFGIGQFSFTPTAGNIYKAIASSDRKEVVVQALQKSKETGYVLTALDDGSGSLSINVSTNLNADLVYLFVHTGKQLVLAESSPLNNKTARFNLDKRRLEDGVSCFTIFNAAGQPVCERLYFKKPEHKLIIEASSDAKLYKRREKVNVNLATNDEAGKHPGVDLSMSVRRLDSLEGSATSDIVSYMWLGSELKGSIESPGYYFAADSQEANDGLDNLMLTQGWRQFKSTVDSSGTYIKNLPELNGHLITGKVATVNGKAARNILMHMGVTGRRTQYYGALSDSTGAFLFNTKDFYGTNELVIQTNSQVDSLYQITVNNPFIQESSGVPAFASEYTSSMLKALKVHSLSAQIQNIYTSNKLKEFYDPGIDSSAFYGRPFKSYKLDDYTRFTTMEEVLREYVREVDVVRRQQRFHVKMVNGTRYLDGDPLVLLDGIAFFDMDRVMTIDPRKVKQLEVVREQYFLGPTVSQGILNFHTYEGNLGGTEIDPKAVIMDYEGMQLQRVFYAPVYEAPAEKASRLPDFRTTLYWAPDVAIDKQGKGHVSFFTSDQPGVYFGEIAGLTAAGVPGVKYISFEVIK